MISQAVLMSRTSNDFSRDWAIPSSRMCSLDWSHWGQVACGIPNVESSRMGLKGELLSSG
jgi:hypothetical protein